jgi:hypothetical protein
MRNRVSAERSRKNKDVLIDSLRHSIQTYDNSIQDLQRKITSHPMNHLLAENFTKRRRTEVLSQQMSLDSPFCEPAVFII